VAIAIITSASKVTSRCQVWASCRRPRPTRLCRSAVLCYCHHCLRVGSSMLPPSWALGQRPWHPLPLSVPASCHRLRFTVARGSRSLLPITGRVGSGLPAVGPASGNPSHVGHWIWAFHHRIRSARAPLAKGSLFPLSLRQPPRCQCL
jgi:hypothetical protein